MTEHAAPRPSRMEWHRPGFTLRLDEDGLHIINVGQGHYSLEQPEARELVDLYNAIRSHVGTDGTFDKPVPPTREEVRARTSSQQMKYAAEVMARAIDAEINPTDMPF